MEGLKTILTNIFQNLKAKWKQQHVISAIKIIKRLIKEPFVKLAFPQYIEVAANLNVVIYMILAKINGDGNIWHEQAQIFFSLQ